MDPEKIINTHNNSHTDQSNSFSLLCRSRLQGLSNASKIATHKKGMLEKAVFHCLSPNIQYRWEKISESALPTWFKPGKALH